MKRLTIPVLLVVLTLFCATSIHQATAWAGEPDGALRAPSTGKRDPGPTVDTAGDSDPWLGDPDTAGDTVGAKKDMMDLIGGSQGFEGVEDAEWLEILIRLMDCFTILR